MQTLFSTSSPPPSQPQWLRRRRRPAPRRGVSRRRFLRTAWRALAGTLLAGGAYSQVEAKWCRVHRQDIALRNLPSAFHGLRVAFVADTHYGPFVPLAYLRRVVAMTNDLGADVIALGGDYIQRYWMRLVPDAPAVLARGVGVLRDLRAPLGVFAVLGNHDHGCGYAAEIENALTANGFRVLDNSGVWLERGGARLRLCGLHDISSGHLVDLPAALGDTGPEEAAVAFTHNPDVVEEITDRRIGIVLCGHTHGGQVVLPFLGAPVVPSRFDQKYLHGLVQGPVVPAFITRGVGTILPPVRMNCPPEVALLTLRPA